MIGSANFHKISFPKGRKFIHITPNFIEEEHPFLKVQEEWEWNVRWCEPPTLSTAHEITSALKHFTESGSKA